MRFSTNNFNNFLNGIGQQVSWRQAWRCPCQSEFSGAAQVNCPQCNGKGVIWAATGTSGVVGVVAQKVANKWATAGNWEDGDVGVTIGSDSPLYGIGRNDRVMLLNASEHFNRVYTHGVPPETLDLPIIMLDRVFWLSDDKKTIIDGNAPIFDSNGNMSWDGYVQVGYWETGYAGGVDGEPPIGSQYTISGTAYVEYFVWQDFPSNRNEHSGMPLPKKLQLRKLDLFGR